MSSKRLRYSPIISRAAKYHDGCLSHVKTLNGMETRIYDSQYTYILKHYGKHAASIANYGAGVDTGNDRVDVMTKIYGIGVLASTAIMGKDKIEHTEYGSGNSMDIPSTVWSAIQELVYQARLS